VRRNIRVIGVSVSTLSENGIFGVDLRSILSVHLSVVYELLARIADPTSQSNCYFLRALAYVFLVYRELLMEQRLRTRRVLLDEFEGIGLILVVEHDEFVGVGLIVHVVDGVLEAVDEWLD